MDKRDFYKQLMLEYTFNQEKIRRSAKRDIGKAARALNSKWLPLASAAAVFVTVFGGYMALNLNQDNGNIIIEQPHVLISPEQRILETEIKMLNSRHTEQLDMYLSFEKPLTLSEIEFTLGLLSDTGEIEILSLYDKGLIDKTAGIDGQKFMGAKISAPINLLSDIRALNAVVFVDLATDRINDGNFTPLTESEIKNAAISMPPIQNVIPETSAQPEIKPPETTGSEENPGFTEDELVELPPDTENPPVEITILALQTEGANAVEFINDDHFLVFSNNSVELYRIATEPQRDFEFITGYEIKNPKVSNINYDQSVFMITGEDVYDVRNQLYVINGETLSFKPVEMKLYDSWLAYTYYYPNGAILSKAKSYGYEGFYYSVPDVNGVYQTRKLCEFEIQAPLLSVEGGKFIYALSDEGESSLFEYEIETGAVTPLNFTINGKTMFVRSADLTTFAALSPESTWIYNYSDSAFIETKKASAIYFSKANTKYFSLDNEYYMINGSELLYTGFMPAEDSTNFSKLYSIYAISEIDVKFKVY